MRFTATRAVSGLSPLAIQSASWRRPLSPDGIGAGRFCDTTRTNPRGTRSPSAWALPRIVIRMPPGLAESCTAKATGTAGVKNSACSMSVASFFDAGLQISSLLLECLPRRPVDHRSPLPFP